MEDSVNTSLVVYADDTPAGCLALRLPGALQGAEIMPEWKARLAVIQMNNEKRWQLAWDFVRSKVPVALFDVEEEELWKLNKIAVSAKRSKKAAVLLGSWRYIPAVAAVKEIVCTGCLGKLSNAVLSLREDLNDELICARGKDVLSFIAGNGTVEKHSMKDWDVSLHVEGSCGSISTCFTLDGQNAEFTKTIQGRTYERSIPQANPFISELAILSLLTKGTEKIGKLDMLMPIF